jgi:hypothetical protein
MCWLLKNRYKCEIDRSLLNMRILAENSLLVVEHEYENAMVRFKQSGEVIEIGDHYGDPIAAVVDPKGCWAAVGGEGLTVWVADRYVDPKYAVIEPRGGWVEVGDGVGIWDGANIYYFLRRGPDNTHFVHSMRFEHPNGVRVLIDPWSDKAATWLLTFEPLSLKKLRDGPSRVDQPYEEIVHF